MQRTHNIECCKVLRFYSMRYFGVLNVWAHWPNLVALGKEEAQAAFYGADVLCAIVQHYEKIETLASSAKNIATNCEHLRASIRYRHPYVELIPINVAEKLEKYKVYSANYEANKKFYKRLARRHHITYHIAPLKVKNELA
ncbi:hypothetical protein [Helicobacter suis]|uniref:hypothetical protein n=1 Tax=Helicobacter suis TaxID=104628 RepID=UPI0013D5497F|nr:hypothetical protein [Helicobacter suis]